MENTDKIEKVNKTHFKKTELSFKTEGMLIGVAIGDALGAPHERATNPYTGKIKLPYTVKYRFGYDPGETGEKKNIFTSAIGQITDDTEMMIVLTRSLIKNDGLDKRDLIRDYMRWANDRFTISMGANTRALFKVNNFDKYNTVYHNMFNDKKSKNSSQSNGALMRCAPLVFFSDKVVKKECSFSNPSKVSIQCELIQMKMLRFLLFGQEFELNKDDYEENIVKALNEAEKKKERNLEEKIQNKSNKGWCVHGLYCSYYCFLHFDSFENAMDYVIGLGGDTDTNAAIAGAIMGAKLGINIMSKENKTEYNLNKVLSCDTSKGDIPRQKEYTSFKQMSAFVNNLIAIWTEQNQEQAVKTYNSYKTKVKMMINTIIIDFEKKLTHSLEEVDKNKAITDRLKELEKMLYIEILDMYSKIDK